ncbi:chaperone protein HSP31 [Pseudohyphozyma bogoriensis]|nr:chaperone protein HSP31 [Pseudohyphozyma bogoriensis]
MSPVPQRALIAITSANPDFGEHKSGLFVSEALHPFEVLRKNGFEVDFVSETGQWAPDDISLGSDWLSAEEKAIYEDPSSEFRSNLDNIKTPSQLKASDYGLFYASAGHASLIDYPTAVGIHAIIASVYESGGVIAAVCHAGAIFNNLKLSSGEYLIAGKKVTGFTTQGEEALGVLDIIQKQWSVQTIESGAAGAGGIYVAPAGPWDVFTVVDGRLVTGVNPQSATKTAEDAVAVFKQL